MKFVADDTYAPCPNTDCNGDVEILGGSEIGEILVCDECGVDAKIVDIDSDGKISLEMVDEDSHSDF